METYTTILDREARLKPSPNDAKALPTSFYEALPTATSVRLLDVLDSQRDGIRCRLRTVDLEDEPEFAALSYTWGNPTTVYDEPLPDTSHLRFPEDSDQFPFMYTTGPLGPEGETMASVDCIKRDYVSIHPRIPYEKAAWKTGTTRQITVNDCVLEVEENLFEYLTCVISMRSRYLHKKGFGLDQLHDHSRLPMWIDALRINQNDLSERAAQVQLMGRIYKSAKVILAWIGQDDDLCNVAFTSINKILAWELAHMDDIFGKEDGNTPRRRDQDHITLSSIPDMTVVHWFALFALFQRLWFRRAWIAQEAIFAKNLLVICGGKLINFTLLLLVFAILEDNGLDYELCRVGRNLLTGQPVAASTLQLEKFGALSRKLEQAISAAHSHQLSVVPWDVYSFVLGYHRVRGCLGLSEVGRPMIWPRKPGELGRTEHSLYNVEIPTEVKLKDTIMEEVEPGVFRFRKRPLRLLSILSEFRNLDATDPRDKIFAFLSLATDNLGLIPNYHTSVQDVFLDATKQMMIQYDSLAVLSHCQDPADTKISGLPGWVPAFSVRLRRSLFDIGGEISEFSASGYWWHPHFDFCPDGSLEMEGFRVDTVSTTTDLEGDAVVKILTLLLQVPAKYPVILLVSCDKRLPDNKSRRELQPRIMSRIEALWRTLIADALTEVDELPDSLDSRDGLSSGFRIWILADILEAHGILAQFIVHGWLFGPQYMTTSTSQRARISAPRQWKKLSWTSQQSKRKRRINTSSTSILDWSIQLSASGISQPPTELGECFKKHIDESDQEEKAQGSSSDGSYRPDTLQRLTNLQRRQLRNFEKYVRKLGQPYKQASFHRFHPPLASSSLLKKSRHF